MAHTNNATNSLEQGMRIFTVNHLSYTARAEMKFFPFRNQRGICRIFTAGSLFDQQDQSSNPLIIVGKFAKAPAFRNPRDFRLHNFCYTRL
jgi:hypothetical protein